MIFVDTRDGSSDLIDFLDPDICEPTRLDFPIDGKPVPCGDAMIVGNGPNASSLMVGVEVKSVHDALSSISTGRLGGTQIQRMLKVYDVSFLLIYGVCRPGPDNFLQVRQGKGWRKFRLGRRYVPWSYFEGFLLTAQLLATLSGKPLFVKQCYDIREAAVWLTILHHWLDKPWDKHKGLSVFDRSREMVAPPDVDPVEAQIARTAASLPGIDWTRGWAAARHFDSVIDMLTATTSDWQEIKGIGPVLARSAYEIVRRKK